ncbi:hypothetical protein AB0M46_47140 [Dactylosporangium sp. NPDC051485]|uniref:hypothetical protein n=1 Tax=Dactylosporangium sp. NPDC051485 TaxID=3154846 RepID=UPI0034230027
MKSVRRISLAAAGLAATGAMVFGAASLASAETASPSPGATAGSSDPGRGGSHDKAVTGDELAKVTAAMKAKDSAVTVKRIHKDPDGSYHVLGTKDGDKVLYDVSADLKTITLHTGGHGRGHGDGGRGWDGKAVTGDELAKVTAAIQAKDSAVTVKRVHKDPDGSYHALGTKDGDKVLYDVSADLKTITLHTGGHGDGGRGWNDKAVTGDELAKVTAAMKAKDSAVTVVRVHKDPDGSYHVLGTKDGDKIVYDVSADLKTFTLHTGGHGARK